MHYYKIKNLGIRVFMEPLSSLPEGSVELTEEQFEKVKRIDFLKIDLSKTDYKALKYFEGYYTEEQYAPIKAERQRIRDEINALQEEIDNL